MTISPSDSGQPPKLQLDTSVAQPAGSTTAGRQGQLQVDREVAGELAETFPGIRDTARQARQFLFRAIRYLVAEQGIRQFLDVGTGLPTANNTHEIAQGMVPQARIVYVDNDPLVLVHARALLTSHPQGATDYIDADVRDPDTILRRLPGRSTSPSPSR